MSIITEEVKALINDEKTVKVLATVSKKGEVNSSVVDHIETDEEGNIVIYELLESSANSKNLVYSLWFEKKVSLTLSAGGGIRYQIKGIPVRDTVTGPAYEKKYREFSDINPENDLAGIWVIKPVEVREETYALRLKEEREKYPVIGHMDKDIA